MISSNSVIKFCYEHEIESLKLLFISNHDIFSPEFHSLQNEEANAME